VEYALLYTFSTIPQTLAAALGVLAAFVQWQDAYTLVSQFRSARVRLYAVRPNGGILPWTSK
jgi:hypothetical protein